MHNLIKFFSCKEYLDSFIAGRLYMNSLDYFWTNGFEDQKDIFEGIVCTVPVKEFGAFSTSFQSVQATDYHFRAEGYKNCNVLCFYKLKYTYQGPVVSYSYDNRMSEFGEYIAFITNEQEFLRRISVAVHRENYKYLCGEVNYHEQILNGHPSKEGNRLYLAAKDHYFTVQELRDKGFSIHPRDCFDKGIQYYGQSEWRIALYRGMKNTNAYVLDVGDLSDIVVWFPFKQFQKRIEEYTNRYGFSEIDGWYGNITRQEMKKLFYELGEQKTVLIASIG